MNIYLENNELLTDLLSATLRHDLVPIPVTLELFAVASEMAIEQLEVGKKLRLNDGTILSIVKVQQVQTNIQQDGVRVGGISAIAVLAGCESLIYPSKTACIQDNITFSNIYRSVGAKVQFGQDIKVGKFVCLKGQYASNRIAFALQKEASVLAYQDGKMNVMRIQELLKNEGRYYHSSGVQWIDHAQYQHHTHYLSVDDSDIIGQVPTDLTDIQYIPQCDHRELNNLKRVLVVRGIILRSLDDGLIAGNVVVIDGVKYVVLTSASRFDTGKLGNPPVMASKAWIARMV